MEDVREVTICTRTQQATRTNSRRIGIPGSSLKGGRGELVPAKGMDREGPVVLPLISADAGAIDEVSVSADACTSYYTATVVISVLTWPIRTLVATFSPTVIPVTPVTPCLNDDLRFGRR